MISIHTTLFRVTLAASALAWGCSSSSPTATAVPVISSVAAVPAIVAPGATVTVTVVANDASNGKLTYTWTVPTGWTAAGSTTNPSIVLTAPATFGQSAVVGVSVADGKGNTVASQATVATLADQAPVISAVTATPNPAPPGSTIALVATGSSPTQQTLTYAWTSSSSGWTVTSGTGGNATVTAPSTFGTSTVLSVTATDPSGATAHDQILVSTVTDQPPVITSLVASQNQPPNDGSFTLLASAYSPTGSELTYFWTTSVSTWTVTGSGNTAVLTAPSTSAASTVVTVVVTDSNNLSATTSTVVSSAGESGPAITTLSATPNPASPGATITLLAVAVAPGGGAAPTYSWTTSSVAWHLTSGSGGTATLVAPSTYAANTVVTVTATGANGAAATSQLLVSTIADPGPVVSQILWTPTNPQVGAVVTLSAEADVSPIGTPTYAWTLASVPAGSAATLSSPTSAAPSFTPDKPGSYTVSVVVTDASGLSSPIAVATLTVATPNPIAVAKVVTALPAAVNTPVSLDGSASSTLTGGALEYAWSLLGGPAGGTLSFYADHALQNPSSSVVSPYCVGTVAGSYIVQLTVTDSLSGLTGTATVTVTLVSVASLKLVTGNNQTATVGQFLTNPIVFEAVAANGTTPVPGQALQVVAVNGSYAASTGSLTTDANGLVTLLVQGGYVAGTGSITASLVGITGAGTTATASFTLQADAATSIALAPGVGNTDTGATMTVEVVDKYFNQVAPPAGSGTIKVLLSATGQGGGAPAFVPATGVIVDSSTGDATVTLANGTRSVAITDTSVEIVSLTMTGAGNLTLPFSVWQTTVYDGTPGNALQGLDVANAADGADWGVALDDAELDPAAAYPSTFAIKANPFQVSQAGVSTLGWGLAVGGTVSQLAIDYMAAVPSAVDTQNNCTAQPAMYAALEAGFEGTEYLVAPSGGYAVPATCVGHPSFAGTDGAWSTATYDITNALSAGAGTLALVLATAPDAANVNQTATFNVGLIRESVLMPTAWASVTASLPILPGAPAGLVFQATPVTYDNCGDPSTTLYVTETDAEGNLVQGNVTVDLSWTGTTTQPAYLTSGTLAGTGPKGVDVVLSAGQAAGTFQDNNLMNPENVTFTVTSPGSGLSINPPTQIVDFPVSPGLACYQHSNGFGGTWTDSTPLGTYTADEALAACYSYYGPSVTCSTTSSVAYLVESYQCTGNGLFPVWYYAPQQFSDDCNFVTESLAAGQTDEVQWNDGYCGYCEVAGEGEFASCIAEGDEDCNPGNGWE